MLRVCKASLIIIGIFLAHLAFSNEMQQEFDQWLLDNQDWHFELKAAKREADSAYAVMMAMRRMGNAGIARRSGVGAENFETRMPQDNANSDYYYAKMRYDQLKDTVWGVFLKERHPELLDEILMQQ